MPSRTKTLIFGSFEHSSGDGNPVPHKNKPSWHKRIKRPIISNRRSKAIYSAWRRRTNCSPPRYANPKKNIDDCITYILNCVKQSECAGFEDDEIFSMAVHYFDEENIDIGKPLQCDVRIDHVVELTEEEKAQARQAAMKRAQDEAYAKLKQPKKKSPAAKDEPAVNVEQASLF